MKDSKWGFTSGCYCKSINFCEDVCGYSGLHTATRASGVTAL